MRFAGRVTLWLIELFIYDFPDGARTASATNSATEKSVDRARGTARHHPCDSSHLLVAQLGKILVPLADAEEVLRHEDGDELVDEIEVRVAVEAPLVSHALFNLAQLLKYLAFAG